jgi:hypothetical protein
MRFVYKSSPIHLPDTETGADNDPLPSLLVPETWTEISVESTHDEDGSSSLCSQVPFPHDSTDTVADAQAIPVIESVYVMVYDEVDPSIPSEILNGSYKTSILRRKFNDGLI